MPIEIRELVVRARIDPGGDPGTGSPPRAAGRGAAVVDDDRRQQEMVRAAVREALRAAEDRRER